MEHRVLLIDDERDAHEILFEVVSNYLHLPDGETVTLTYTNTAEEGKALIEQGGWVAIFCDLNLANSSDSQRIPSATATAVELISLAARLRRERGWECPILVLTNYSTDHELETEARAGGADRVMGKDTDPSILGKRISEAVRKAISSSPPPPPSGPGSTTAFWAWLHTLHRRPRRGWSPA